MFVFTRIILLQPMKLYLFSFQSDLVEFIALVQFSPYNEFYFVKSFTGNATVRVHSDDLPVM